jgi:hypothetical protein
VLALLSCRPSLPDSSTSSGCTVQPVYEIDGGIGSDLNPATCPGDTPGSVVCNDAMCPSGACYLCTGPPSQGCFLDGGLPPQNDGSVCVNAKECDGPEDCPAGTFCASGEFLGFDFCTQSISLGDVVCHTDCDCPQSLPHCQGAHCNR